MRFYAPFITMSLDLNNSDQAFKCSTRVNNVHLLDSILRGLSEIYLTIIAVQLYSTTSRLERVARAALHCMTYVIHHPGDRMWVEVTLCLCKYR
jgi:hypothetical protein